MFLNVERFHYTVREKYQQGLRQKLGVLWYNYGRYEKLS